METFRVALTDFGLSRSTSNKTALDVFCPRWSSPELLLTKMPTISSDIWAMGIVFWEVWENGKRPFNHLSSELVVAEVSAGTKPEFPSTVPGNVLSVCLPCFDDANVRWDSRAMMNTWLKLSREQKKRQPGMRRFDS